MLSNIIGTFHASELLRIWAGREFKIRYSQTFLGAVWAVLQPLALMIMFTLIFSLFMQVPTDGIPYPVFAYAALLPWTFFSNSVGLAIPSLVNNMNLVSKIAFPREILPLATVVVGLADFVIAALIFVALMIIYQIPVQPTMLLIPVILLVQIILMFGIALLGSSLNVFYRDIRFVIPLLLQLLMYLSPVIYPVSIVPESLRPFYLLNPLAVLIDSYRRVILFGTLPDWPYFMLAVVVSLLTLFLGYYTFKKAEPQFADLI